MIEQRSLNVEFRTKNKCKCCLHYYDVISYLVSSASEWASSKKIHLFINYLIPNSQHPGGSFLFDLCIEYFIKYFKTKIMGFDAKT